MVRKHQLMKIYYKALNMKQNKVKIKDIANILNVNLSTLKNWFYSNKQPKVKRPYATKNLGKYSEELDIYPEKVNKKEFAYLLGTLNSDGCSARGFKLTAKDKDFCEANKIILEKIIGKKIKLRKFDNYTEFGDKHNPTFYEINIVRKKLKKYLEEYKINFKTNEEIYWFISGFFDGDGCISVQKTHGTILLAQRKKFILVHIQKLLNKVNIESKLKYNKSIDMYYLYFSKKEYMLKLYKYGNISIKRKKDKIKYILLNGNKKYKLEDINNEKK